MKLKYYFPTSFTHLWGSIVACMLFMGLVISIMAVPANALKEPWEYGMNECELIAKDVQKVYYGSLVFIQPLKDNGAYDLGEYSGHFVNKVYFSGVGVLYWDYQTGYIGTSEEQMLQWYTSVFGKNADIFDLSEERTPFSMIWHY